MVPPSRITATPVAAWTTFSARSMSNSAPRERRLFDRFTGLKRGHGHFQPENTNGNGKLKGKFTTEYAPATPELWSGHLAGVYGLGIIPIRDDATVRWGAIDIDGKPDLAKIASDIGREGLPIVVCRSKSGGVHLYLFSTEDIPAAVVREKLTGWAALLGHAGAEVFPKQNRLAGPRDFGNWLNMPYFGGQDSERHAIDAEGERLTLDAFLDLADNLAVSRSELEDIGTPTDPTVEGALFEAPPCLQCIAGRGGAGEGHRNKMMFNLAVYARKRHGDDYADHLDTYNQSPYLESPLPTKELTAIRKSVSKKAYEYNVARRGTESGRRSILDGA